MQFKNREKKKKKKSSGSIRDSTPFINVLRVNNNFLLRVRKKNLW